MKHSSLKFVGNTPVHQLDGTNIFVKLEKFNLGGSVKDRAVLGMIEEAEIQGKLNKDTLIIEPTSGNTGISIALLSSVLGYKAILVMPESMSVERRALIKAYGAQLILTPKELGMKGAIAKATELTEKYENSIILSQFDNPANPNYHYKTTAEEILKQVPSIDVFVSGIGTGGTFTGVSKFLKENKSDILAVAVEPKESPAISEGTAGVHRIQGIGAGFVPNNFERELMDEIVTVSSEEAIEEAKNFMLTTGIGVGISSGAAIVGAKRIAEKYPEKTIVTILPDGADKYFSMFEFEDVKYIEE